MLVVTLFPCFRCQIWTEYNERTPSDQEVGNVNYLPGMGAFLQSIIFGFGGFRIRPDRLEVFNPMPPPGATKLMLYGFQYLQANLTFTIEVDKTTIQAISVTSKYPLILRRNVSMAVEESITTGKLHFTIITTMHIQILFMCIITGNSSCHTTI